MLFIVWSVIKCQGDDIYTGNGDADINYCAVDNSDPSVSNTFYVSATATSSSTTCTSTTSACTTVKNGVSKASTSGWSKIILMSGSNHNKDTAEIQIGTKSIWITGESADVVFTPNESESTTINHIVFNVTTGSLRFTDFQIKLEYSFSTDNIYSLNRIFLCKYPDKFNFI